MPINLQHTLFALSSRGQYKAEGQGQEAIELSPLSIKNPCLVHDMLFGYKPDLTWVPTYSKKEYTEKISCLKNQH